eukprot:439906-Amphidinium_carterae.1
MESAAGVHSSSVFQLLRSDDELILTHFALWPNAWPIPHLRRGWHDLCPVEEALRAAFVDLQVAATSRNDLLNALFLVGQQSDGSPRQHGDLQHVPVLLHFRSEGAVQQQLVRC